jgi:hypothetical protein
MLSKVAQRSVTKAITEAEGLYQVETYTPEGPESRCDLCCGWGHIENQCGSKPKYCYYSGHHRNCDHNCNVVGCAAKQGSLGGHIVEK